jgi:hypothetical protein
MLLAFRVPGAGRSGVRERDVSSKPRSFWLTNHVANPVLRPILRGPLGWRFGRHLAVIRYRGRRTGTTRELVTQYARDRSTVWIVPGTPERKSWWRNLRDPTRVELWLAGQHVFGQARAIEGSRDPAAVRAGLVAYLAQLPRVRKSLNLPTPSAAADSALDEFSTRAVVVRVDLET